MHCCSKGFQLSSPSRTISGGTNGVSGWTCVQYFAAVDSWLSRASSLSIIFRAGLEAPPAEPSWQSPSSTVDTMVVGLCPEPRSLAGAVLAVPETPISPAAAAESLDAMRWEVVRRFRLG